jgi:hypothetical protein
VETAEPALILESTLCSSATREAPRALRKSGGGDITPRGGGFGARLAVLVASFVPFIAYATRAFGPFALLERTAARQRLAVDSSTGSL